MFLLEGHILLIDSWRSNLSLRKRLFKSCEIFFDPSLSSFKDFNKEKL